MSQTGSPERRATPGEESLPRLLQLDEEVTVFDGLRETAEINGMQSGYFSRADCLILPVLGGLVLNVAWHNHQNRFYKSQEVTDPFNLGKTFDPIWRGNQIFSAVLDLAPETVDAAWREEEGRFIQAPSSAARGETAQAEFTKLLVRKLTAGLKLELVDTPTGSHTAHAESETARPITFRQFRPFGWEIFGGTSSDPKHLYIPNPSDLGSLRAKFTTDDFNFSGSGVSPLVGGRSA